MTTVLCNACIGHFSFLWLCLFIFPYSKGCDHFSWLQLHWLVCFSLALSNKTLLFYLWGSSFLCGLTAVCMPLQENMESHSFLRCQIFAWLISNVYPSALFLCISTFKIFCLSITVFRTTKQNVASTWCIELVPVFSQARAALPGPNCHLTHMGCKQQDTAWFWQY